MGIETIVLTSALSEDRNVRMSRFLAALRDVNPADGQHKRYVASDILDRLETELQTGDETDPGEERSYLLDRLRGGEVPFSLKSQLEDLIELARAGQNEFAEEALGTLSTIYALQFETHGPTEEPTYG